MTRDEILAMEAGRELDALVAVEVMEWTRYPNKHGLTVMSRPGAMPHHAQIDQHPNFSTDIAATWEAAEAMCQEHGLYFRLHRTPDYIWAAFDKWSDLRLSVEAQAPTAPLAISRAVLLAVMEVDA